MTDIPPLSSLYRRLWLIAVAALLIGGPMGCDRGLELIPVTGEVRLDGKPLDGCSVIFSPVAGGPSASGSTDAKGRFELRCVNRLGAVPGEHRVAIAKNVSTLVSDPTGAHSEMRVEWFTPQRYSRPDTSGIQKNVSSDEHDFVFDLSSK